MLRKKVLAKRLSLFAVKSKGNMENNNRVDLETPVITALAVASKTPFLTAFKATLGIGLARFLMFFGVVTTIVLAVKVLK